MVENELVLILARAVGAWPSRGLRPSWRYSRWPDHGGGRQWWGIPPIQRRLFLACETLSGLIWFSSDWGKRSNTVFGPGRTTVDQPHSWIMEREHRAPPRVFTQVSPGFLWGVLQDYGGPDSLTQADQPPPLVSEHGLRCSQFWFHWGLDSYVAAWTHRWKCSSDGWQTHCFTHTKLKD